MTPDPTAADASTERIARFYEAWTQGGGHQQRIDLIYGLAVMPDEANDDDPTRELLASDLAVLVAYDRARQDQVGSVADVLREAREQMRRSGGQTITLNGNQLDRMLRQLDGYR